MVTIVDVLDRNESGVGVRLDVGLGVGKVFFLFRVSLIWFSY